jgi:hypothetical protein
MPSNTLCIQALSCRKHQANMHLEYFNIKHIVFNDNKIIDNACRNDINNCACLILLFCGEKYFLIKVPNIRYVYISKYFYIKYKV